MAIAGVWIHGGSVSSPALFVIVGGGGGDEGGRDGGDERREVGSEGAGARAWRATLGGL